MTIDRMIERLTEIRAVYGNVPVVLPYKNEMIPTPWDIDVEFVEVVTRRYPRRKYTDDVLGPRVVRISA